MIDANYRVIDIIQLSTDYLDKRGIENPRLNVELLLGHVLKFSRVQLYLNFERPLTAVEMDQVRELLKRRANHEPIQYIIGETEFFSLKFKVNRHTLIPRPETELLVETVIEQSKKSFDPAKEIRILEIGTGCGNIAVSLAKHIEGARITAIDIHDEALSLARQNAAHHQASDKIDFVRQDIFAKIDAIAGIYHIIVSNPPYISREEFKQLPREVKDFEPYLALEGGEDGLNFYVRLAEISEELLATRGFLATEIGAFQADKIHQLFSVKKLFGQIEIIKDLNTLPRVLLAKR